LLENRPVLLVVAALMAATAGLWPVAQVLSGARTAQAGPVLAAGLAVAFAAAEVVVVHFPLGREVHSLSLVEVPLVLALLFFSPEHALAARTLGAGLVLALHYRQPALKLAFNLSSFALSTVAALTVSSLVGTTSVQDARTWAGVLLGVIVADVVSAVALALVLAATQGGLADLELAETVGAGQALTLTVAATALAGVVLFRADRAAVLLLVPVAVAVWLLGRGLHALRLRHRRLEALHTFTRAVDLALQDENVVPTVLEQARTLMRARLACLVLLHGAAERRVGDPELGEQDWWRPGADAPLIRRSGGAEDPGGIAVPLRSGHSMLGVLVVAGRLDAVTDFDEDDRLLLESLAGHAAVALRNGELVDAVREQARAKEALALHDHLTGLPNRVALQEELERALDAPDAAGWLAIIDLARFREVNDTLGHEVGDELLKQVAGLLREALPPSTFLARLGGDQFAAARWRTAAADEQPEAVLAGLRRALVARPVPLQTVDLDLDVTVGFVRWPGDGASASALLRRADVALYAAKTTPSRCARYSTDIDSFSQRRLMLAGDLSRALARGDLQVVYQPQARADGCEVDGFEALVRWTHPLWGPVAPDEFVPVAEQTGLIRALTRHVLSTATRQAGRWVREGHAVRISVNISMRNLAEPDFVRVVEQALSEAALPASALTLEITESAVMTEGGRQALDVLRRLRGLGVDLSIDDFGTGYSSLAHLRDLPVRELKIDRSFVRHLVPGADLDPIVGLVARLAQNLGLRVVAEGVEDAETWAALRALGCDLVQGFYLSRPMEAAVATDWLRDHAARTPVADSPVAGV
jgi:diguanylate cyclase (GGDEF)-like protein